MGVDLSVPLTYRHSRDLGSICSVNKCNRMQKWQYFEQRWYVCMTIFQGLWKLSWLFWISGKKQKFTVKAINGRVFSTSKDGAVVRVLACHQCGPSLIAAQCYMWFEPVVGSRLTLRVFPGSPVFLLPQKHLQIRQWWRSHVKTSWRWCGFLSIYCYLFVSLFFVYFNSVKEIGKLQSNLVMFLVLSVLCTRGGVQRKWGWEGGWIRGIAPTLNLMEGQRHTCRFQTSTHIKQTKIPLLYYTFITFLLGYDNTLFIKCSRFL